MNLAGSKSEKTLRTWLQTGMSDGDKMAMAVGRARGTVSGANTALTVICGVDDDLTIMTVIVRADRVKVTGCGLVGTSVPTI